MIKSRSPARVKYDSDDYNRFSGPEYLDRISLSHAHDHDKIFFNHPPDAKIYEDICEALLNDPMIDSSDIGVQVHHGMVTLTGKVDNREMKKEVEVSIEHVEGIVDVFNLINLHQFRDTGTEGLIKNQARLVP